ncbi:putative inorganic phosphate cotransporter isoform X1 [Argiope bruennichi]|uniref:putative inorganic phosphate cotransporter isoform X1 n=1 Tax=Argiope bruennichi TaxID=94029 RepID=UPI00249586D0|nr:putative inorganic phosphate cotransporter isoform X1 [Argiope bruennichi]
MTVEVNTSSEMKNEIKCYEMQISCDCSSAREKMQNPVLDLTIHKKEGGCGSSLLQYRYLVTLLEFFAFFEINAYRFATSISVVAMVNNTAVYSHKLSNVSDSCPAPAFGEEGYTEPQPDGEFVWSPAEQGWILGAGYLGYLITQIPGGILGEMYGGKIVVMMGLLLSTLCHIISPFAARAGTYTMIAVQLARGLGQGLIPAAHCVIAANWFPSTERGVLNPISMAGYSMGALAGGVTSGALCSLSFLGGWPLCYYVDGIFGIVLCICYQILLYETPKSHPRIKESELNYILQNQEMDLTGKRPPTPWKKIFTSVPFHAMTFATFATFWAGSHFLSVHPIFLATILHFPIEENGIISSVPFLFDTLLICIGSWISKWLNKCNYVGVDKVRKGFNFLYCMGYSLCVLGVYYVGCDKTASTIMGFLAMSFFGFSYNGCLTVPNDMSPTYAANV